MKTIKCPKCNNLISFDETQYEDGKVLVFTCSSCGKKFAVKNKRPVFKPYDTIKAPTPAPVEEEPEEQLEACGSIVVIENVFHYKQEITLHIGENVIGRYQKGVDINCPIHTDDPSIDMTHCVITASKDKRGGYKYILRDGPSNTGTFVDNEILGDRERRIIYPNTLFTIGATSIILKGTEEQE